MRTGPGNKDAQASWIWPVPPGAAGDLEFADLRLLFVELQVLQLKLLQELNCETLKFLGLDFLRVEPLKETVLDP